MSCDEENFCSYVYSEATLMKLNKLYFFSYAKTAFISSSTISFPSSLP